MLFWEVAKDDLEDIFRWIPYSVKTPEDFQRLIEKAFDEQQRGESVVFATVEQSSGRVIGSTRFMNIDRVNRRVEIGSTWIAPAWQRTTVNTEAKYLMLRHALKRGMHAGGTQDRRVESEVAQCDFAHRCERRRDVATAPDHLDRARARDGIFQHPR
jgi:RimJ/RimL family protein N-acetyltransferase